jgi:adenylyl-sulfate kinase
MTQKCRIIWLYGRPCSGKTTIAEELIEQLSGTDSPIFFIDADFLRTGLNRDLGFSMEDRCENIRRASEMASFIALKGNTTVICAFITPIKTLRDLAASVAERNGVPFFPVFIDTPLDECVHRDVKGHYKSASKGLMVQFTGISSPFEEPSGDEIRISTLNLTPAECARTLISTLKSANR